MERKTIAIAISMTNSHLLNTGLGEFENSIATRLAQRAPELEARHGIRLVFIVDRRQAGAYGNAVGYHVMGKWQRGMLKHWVFTPLRRLLAPRCDILHWTNQLYKYRVRIAPVQIITVHDANYLHNDIKWLHKLKKSFVMRRRLAQATHFTFVSQFTADDIKAHFNVTQPSRVILNGVTNLNTKPQDYYDRTLQDMHLPDHFLFHISRWSRKKNVLLQLEMMKHLPEEHLVLAGTGTRKFEQLVSDTIERLQLRNVTVVGRVSGERKAALLSRCKALVFPSLSEGFGLPVVEAMCFGKPSFITRLTSLPEVGGDISYYFSSLDPRQMADTVRQGLADFQSDPQAKAEALKARAATFNWDRAADQYIQFYTDILSGQDKSQDARTTF